MLGLTNLYPSILSKRTAIQLEQYTAHSAFDIAPA